MSRLLFITIFLFLSSQTFVVATPRVTDQEILDSGRDLFRTHCAVCHGQNAEGITPNWQERDASGKMPPPPLNGTAHAWHHPIGDLMRTIRLGTVSVGGTMPSWSRDLLTDEEILAIILWFSSLWPDDLFEYWMEMNRSVSTGR